MNYYKKDKIIKVKVNKPYPARFYTYHEERKNIFGFVTQKAGYYSWFNDSFFGTEIPEGHMIIDNILHEKAEVVLFYPSEIKRRYSFDSYEEAIEFKNGIITPEDWIE